MRSWNRKDGWSESSLNPRGDDFGSAQSRGRQIRLDAPKPSTSSAASFPRLCDPSLPQNLWQRCLILRDPPTRTKLLGEIQLAFFGPFNPSTRCGPRVIPRWPKGEDEAVGHAHPPLIPIALDLIYASQCRRIFIPARGQPLACSPALSWPHCWWSACRTSSPVRLRDAPSPIQR